MTTPTILVNTSFDLPDGSAAEGWKIRMIHSKTVAVPGASGTIVVGDNVDFVVDAFGDGLIEVFRNEAVSATSKYICYAQKPGETEFRPIGYCVFPDEAGPVHFQDYLVELDPGTLSQFEAATIAANTAKTEVQALVDQAEAAASEAAELAERLDDYVGTGPILIAIAGQSNAVGSNTGGPNPSNALVKTWDAVGGVWLSGGQYDALPWTRSAPDGSGGNNNFSLGAAHYLAEKTGREVYIVFDAVGGQPISEWVDSGAASTRYASLKTKIEAALATPQFTSVSKTQIDALIWAQGEADFERSFADYLTDITTLDAQFKAETWVDEWTPFFIMGMSPLHDRYQVSAALRHFSNKSNGQWRYLSTRALRTEFQETGSGDFTHWLGDSLFAGGYDNIGPAILNNERFSNEDNDGLFWNRANGNASVADSTVIASFDTLVSWPSRSGGVGLSDTFSGNGTTTSFGMVYRGTSISSVTVDGVEQSSPADYSVSGQTITFTSAPASGSDNVVVTYGASITGVAATGSLGWGYACYPDGNYTFAGGYNVWTDNLANYTILYGRELSTDSNGDFGAGFGFQNALSAPYGFAAGRGHTIADDYGAAVGKFSEYTTDEADDVLFQVGRGGSTASRSNAFAARTSGTLEAKHLSTYADNAAAISGGLVAGQIYKTSTGELRIVV